MNLYRQYRMDESLVQHMVVNGEQSYLYVGSAFSLQPWLQTAFNKRAEIVAQNAFNAAKSSTCE